ncbi:MAG: hypothetical protein J6B01_04930 [Ruminococcus sp.]|nr:hypothetical protein [Ruminococcus sp.]MBO5319136.1 hypothetical protein [Ruminococcus sp.]
MISVDYQKSLEDGMTTMDKISESYANLFKQMSVAPEIDLINDILENAVRHGADAGGSYDQNEDNLKQAINRWLVYKKLDSLYEVINTHDCSHWCRLKIVEKG